MAEDTPRFKFEVNLRIARLSDTLKVQNPSLLTDKVLDQAWSMLSDFVIDMLDEKGMDVNDEELREIIVELCYWIAYREMFTLFVAPDWEKSELNRLGTGKLGPGSLRRKKGSYGDDWSQ
jgi:hypothetical protein